MPGRRKRDLLRNLLHQRNKRASNPAILSQSSTTLPLRTTSPPSSQLLGSTQTSRWFSEDALRTLPADEQVLLRKLQEDNAGGTKDAVQQAYEAANEQRRLCEYRRWRVNFRGREIVLRDEADKVVSWVERFKSVGDVVANVDPIHVGLPWAGIRIILEIVVSESRQMAALLTGMNLAMYIANRLGVYWDYFVGLPDTPSTMIFEKSLAKLYALMLQFFADAVKSCQKSSSARIWNAVWNESELNTFEDKCKDWTIQVEIDARNCDRELHQRDRGSLEKILQKLEESVESRRSAEQVKVPQLPTSTVPFLRDPEFIDREELSILEQKLSIPGTRMALVGLGGVGKSQLAIEYCYRVREQSADTWVLWVHASSAARFEESIRKVADDVKIPGREDAKDNIYQLVYDWLRDPKRGKWVLVLDNADDADFLFEHPGSSKTDGGNDESARALQARLDYLPVCAHGSMVITSRNRAIVSKIVDDCNIVTIRPMDEEQALNLLERKLGKRDDPAMLQKLTAVLEHMPLAIAQAAAYIKQRAPRCTVEQYLDKFEKSDRSQMVLLDTRSAELRRDREARNSVMLTWQISFEHICTFRRSAADLLALMSFFDHQSIPELLLRAKNSSEHTSAQSHRLFADGGDDEIDNEAFEDDILVLRDYHFVHVTPDADAFAMHRLVQLAVRRWLTSQAQYQKWVEQSIRNLNSAHPNGLYKNWQRCRTLYPHVKMVLNLEPEKKSASLQWASIMHKAAYFVLEQGSAREAEAMVLASVDVRKAILGDEDEKTLRSSSLLARTLSVQGKFEAAEKMQRRVAEAMERVLGKEHRVTLGSLHDLALELHSQGKYEVAETMNRQLIEVRDRVLGTEHPNTLKSHHNLAMALESQGRFDAAEKIYRWVVEVQERVSGKEHPRTLLSLHNLAGALYSQGEYEAAGEIYRRVLEARERILGKEHPQTLLTLNNIALGLRRQGKYEAAESTHRQLLQVRERDLGEEHPHTLDSLSNLALVLEDQGKYEAAEEMSRQATEAMERVLGKQHPDTLKSLWDLAVLYRRLKRYNTAVELYEQAFAGFVKTLGSSHPKSVQCLDERSSLQEEIARAQQESTLIAQEEAG